MNTVILTFCSPPALNNSMSREERSSAIDKALISFDHQNQTLHDKEIEDTADISLVKMLVFLEFKSNFRRPPIKADMTAITSEISRTCEALEMVYRASSEAVGKSFMRVGIDLYVTVCAAAINHTAFSHSSWSYTKLKASNPSDVD